MDKVNGGMRKVLVTHGDLRDMSRDKLRIAYYFHEVRPTTNMPRAAPTREHQASVGSGLALARVAQHNPRPGIRTAVVVHVLIHAS